jgi:alkylation response protein AidB-like acyl-CoA dehydrogenase
MTAEVQLLREGAAALAKRYGGATTLRARRADSADDSELFKACVELGFQGVALPESYGGVDMGWEGLAALMVEGGKALIDMPLLSGVQLAAEALLVCPEGALRRELLEALAAGEQRIALAWQSEAAHPQLLHPSLHAKRDDQGWVLRGLAPMVTGLLGANGVLLSAQTEEGLGLFYVATGQPGLSIEPQTLIDHRNCGLLRLDDLKLPEVQLLASHEFCKTALIRAHDAARLGLAAQMLGGAQAAYETTLEYLKTRQQFDVPIGSFQALQHRIARVFIRQQLAEAALAQGLIGFNLGGKARARAVALAKAKCGEAYLLAAKEGVQMHGGIGVTDEHEMGFHLKSAQVANQLCGSADACRSDWADNAGY